jgi:hypothetical protein
MTLWIFKPVAAPDESRWLDGPIWSRLAVRAPNAGAARFIASRWEDHMMRPGGEVGPVAEMDYQSALSDPALYAVTEAPRRRDDGPDEVVEVAAPLRPTPAWTNVLARGLYVPGI